MRVGTVAGFHTSIEAKTWMPSGLCSFQPHSLPVPVESTWVEVAPPSVVRRICMPLVVGRGAAGGQSGIGIEEEHVDEHLGVGAHVGVAPVAPASVLLPRSGGEDHARAVEDVRRGGAEAADALHGLSELVGDAGPGFAPVGGAVHQAVQRAADAVLGIGEFNAAQVAGLVQDDLPECTAIVRAYGPASATAGPSGIGVLVGGRHTGRSAVRAERSIALKAIPEEMCTAGGGGGSVHGVPVVSNET